MDMEFMGAGKSPKEYGQQMAELLEIKKDHPNEAFPFIFIDPRRKTVGNQKFFGYEIVNGKVVLEEGCFIKEYIEQHQFSGFKIYPALGYFPFDEMLLPLWKYAEQNCIPLMTHCIRGVVYYRGSKEKSWDSHPLFEQAMGREEYKPLLLPQMKAIDVQEIFTHPLNYVCLLNKEWLAKVVAKTTDPKIKTLFGYNEQTKEIATGLEDLKICFGHFGGEDEWGRFFEKDRDNFSSQLIRKPDFGLDFSTRDSKGKPVPGRMEQYWKSADWYTIICSLMLQHDHVYADISYILHGDLAILPLLRQTLQHQKLKTRVLYGTDFYVVRNHKSDKNMLADMRGGLLKEEFEQISEENPLSYLSRDCAVADKIEVTV
jgi:predicted TIM-barrel fold metal-dependent hydrolase